MKLPSRHEAHISESKSFRILRTLIPDTWVVREVSERDYGIDCYIELANREQRMTGDLVSIQVKSVAGIKWSHDRVPTFTLRNIRIETTNYWFNFATPVFIFLIDIVSEQGFMIPVKEFVRQNYQNYLRQKTFNYVARS